MCVCVKKYLQNKTELINSSILQQFYPMDHSFSKCMCVCVHMYVIISNIFTFYEFINQKKKILPCPIFGIFVLLVIFCIYSYINNHIIYIVINIGQAS